MAAGLIALVVGIAGVVGVGVYGGTRVTEVRCLDGGGQAPAYVACPADADGEVSIPVSIERGWDVPPIQVPADALQASLGWSDCSVRLRYDAGEVSPSEVTASCAPELRPVVLAAPWDRPEPAAAQVVDASLRLWGCVVRPPIGDAVCGEQRVTRLGRWLR